jgi:hypothetical protein
MFRHLLAVEEARARRSNRAFLLLVVDGGSAARRPPSDAGGGVLELAGALAGCLRETDVVGWHRTDFRAGALLTETDPELEAARLVGGKVLRRLGSDLPADGARRIRVRIYRYGFSGDRAQFRCLFAATGGREVSAGTLEERKAVAAGRRRPDTPPRPRVAEASVSRQASA